MPSGSCMDVDGDFLNMFDFTVLCTYLKGDIGQIRKAILLGSAIPLIMFVSWDAVIFCIAPMSGNEDPLAFLIR